MEKRMAPIELDHAHGSRVGIGEYGLCTEIGYNISVFVSDFIQSLIPGYALELPFAFGARPFERMQDT
jgi:hypothetical protein